MSSYKFLRRPVLVISGSLLALALSYNSTFDIETPLVKVERNNPKVKGYDTKVLNYSYGNYIQVGTLDTLDSIARDLPYINAFDRGGDGLVEIISTNQIEGNKKLEKLVRSPLVLGEIGIDSSQ